MVPRRPAWGLALAVLVMVPGCSGPGGDGPGSATTTSRATTTSDAPGVEDVRLRDVRFAQLDFYDSYGFASAENSLWGLVEWTYDAPHSSVHYLHVLADIDYGGTIDLEWVVAGLPLFPSSGRGAVREAAFFDWSMLGAAEGEDVDAVSFFVEATLEPAPEELPDYLLDRLDVDADPVTECRIEIPPAGEFIEPAGAPEPDAGAPAAPRVGAERDLRPVQEGVNQCLPGSFARSLDWLNRTHDLDLGKDAQGIFDDLLGRGVGVVPAGGGTHGSIVADWIKKKSDYAREKTGNKVVTKVWDGGDYIDPIAGVAEDKPPATSFADWIKREVRTEDVEVAFVRTDLSSHIVTAASVVTYPTRFRVSAVGRVPGAGGNLTGIKYRDDEAQGNATRGDSTVKNVPITRGADGKYRFGAESKTIYFAVSESKV